MYYCRNGSCTFYSQSRHGLFRHKCKFKRPQHSQAIQHIASTFLHSTTSDLFASDIPVPHQEKHGDDDPETNGFHGDNNSQLRAEACIVKFCSILDNCTDKGTQLTFKSMLEVLLDDDFDMSFFRARIKGFKCCMTYNEKRFNKEVASEGFIKEDVRYDDGSEIHSSVLYRKDVLEVLRKQVTMAKEGDMEYRCTDGSHSNENNTSSDDYTYSHPMHTSHFLNLQTNLEKRVKSSTDTNVYWSDSKESQSFPGFIQIFTDKTVTTMKANGMAAHAVHAVFLNASKSYRRFLIDNGHTIIGFLPTYILDVSPACFHDTVQDNEHIQVLRETDLDELISADLLSAKSSIEGNHGIGSTTNVVELLDNVTLTSTAKGRQVKIGLLYLAMKTILKGISDTSVNGFDIELCEGEGKKCFPLLVSYCCDIPEAKDMSAVKHNLSTSFPCHRCLVSLDDIKSLTMAEKRCFSETIALRIDVQNELNNAVNSARTTVMDQCRELLNKHSLAPWPSFLEDLKLSSPSFIPGDIYDLFTFEPLHNLHLGISKLLKQCTFHYVTSKHRVSFQHMRKSIKVTIGSKKSPILRGCNNYLRAIQEDSGMSSLKVDFSSKNASITLNGLFLENGIRGMLEGKDYKTVDFVFPFIAAFIDRITQEKSCVLTSIHVSYSELIHLLNVGIDREGLTKRKLSTLRNMVRNLKEKASSFFSNYVEKGLYTLKFHLLDHLAEDVEKHSSLAYLDAGPYEHYNAVVKQFYRKTSRRHDTALEETVRRMDRVESTSTSVERTHIDLSSTRSGTEKQNTQNLVSRGLCVTLLEIRDALNNGFNVRVATVLENLRNHMSDRDIPVLIRLVDELLFEEAISVHDSSVQLKFVNSGYIDGYPVPTLEDYSEDMEIVKFRGATQVSQQRQRVFASNSFGPSKKKLHSNIFLKGSGDVSQFWFAKVLSLFHVSVPSKDFTRHMALVKYYQVTKPKDTIDRVLNCVCLRWETEDDIDHTIQDVPTSKTIEAGERFGLISFQSICGVIHVVRANYAIHPFFKEIPWPYHRFYVNRFLH